MYVFCGRMSLKRVKLEIQGRVAKKVFVFALVVYFCTYVNINRLNNILKRAICLSLVSLLFASRKWPTTYFILFIFAVFMTEQYADLAFERKGSTCTRYNVCISCPVTVHF